MIKEWRTGLEVLHSDDDDSYYYYLCLNLLFILSLVTQVLLVLNSCPQKAVELVWPQEWLPLGSHAFVPNGPTHSETRLFFF